MLLLFIWDIWIAWRVWLVEEGRGGKRERRVCMGMCMESQVLCSQRMLTLMLKLDGCGMRV